MGLINYYHSFCSMLGAKIRIDARHGTKNKYIQSSLSQNFTIVQKHIRNMKLNTSKFTNIALYSKLFVRVGPLLDCFFYIFFLLLFASLSSRKVFECIAETLEALQLFFLLTYFINTVAQRVCNIQKYLLLGKMCCACLKLAMEG